MREPIEPSRRRPAWCEVACWVVVAAFLGYFLYCFIFVAVASCRYPHSRDYGEGVVLGQVKLLLEGRGLYADPAETLRLCTYAPVYHLLVAPFTDAKAPALLPGRLISVLATLGTMLFAALATWELSHRRGAAALGGMLVLAFPWVHTWGTFYRVDMTAIFFTVIAIWWALRWRKSRWVYVAIGWLLLAGFTRQSLIAAPAAITLGLFLDRRRRGLLFGGILLLSAGAIFLGIDLATHHAFYRNVIGGNRVAMKWLGGFETWTDRFFTWYAATSILAMIFAIASLKNPHARIAAIWVIAALIMTLPEKRGAYTNYYLEFLVASAIASAACVPRIVRRFGRRGAAASCAVALGIALQCFGAAWTKDIYPSNIDPSKQVREDRVIAAVRALDGPVIAQDVSYVVLAGKEMAYQPLVMTQLSRAGQWNQSSFVRDIREGRFAGVLLNGPIEKHEPGYLFTVEQVDAMRERYTLKEAWPSNPEGTRGKFLYVPREE